MYGDDGTCDASGYTDIPSSWWQNRLSSIRGYGGCTYDCRLGPRCGDGIVQAGEQCDDGNMLSGDGCSRECTSEIPR